jgi:membrane-associated phospholipid phosphatase
VVTVLLLVSPRPVKAGVPHVLIPAAACVLGGVVAVAVVGLQWHYFTDTVAGAAVGIGTVCGLALILDLPAARRWLASAGRRGPAGADGDLRECDAGRGSRTSRYPGPPSSGGAHP